MEKVNIKDMKKIIGCGGRWTFFGIGTIIVFVSGIIDGFVRPFKCN